MPSLNAMLEHRWAGHARAAWTWLTGELIQLLPKAITDRQPSSPICTIRIDRGGVEIERIANGVGERFRDDRRIEEHDAESWVQLSELIEGARTRIVLGFPDAYGLSLQLPAAAASHLRSAVALQLLDAAPVDPSDLSWNYIVTDRASSSVSVRVVMAFQARLDQVAELFEANGVPAPPIYAELDDLAIRLRAGGAGAVDQARTLNRRAALAGLMLLLLSPFVALGAGHFAIWRAEEKATALQSALRPQLATAREVLSNEASRTALRPLVQLPSISGTTEEFAVRLPPTAHLVELGVSSDETLRFTTESVEGAEDLRSRLKGAHRLGLAEVRDQSVSQDRVRTLFESKAR